MQPILFDSNSTNEHLFSTFYFLNRFFDSGHQKTHQNLSRSAKKCLYTMCIKQGAWKPSLFSLDSGFRQQVSKSNFKKIELALIRFAMNPNAFNFKLPACKLLRRRNKYCDFFEWRRAKKRVFVYKVCPTLWINRLHGTARHATASGPWAGPRLNWFSTRSVRSSSAVVAVARN